MNQGLTIHRPSVHPGRRSADRPSGSRFDPPGWPAVALMGAILVGWTGWFAYLSLERWASFAYQTFDLGIFNQGLWLLSRGQEPFVTLRGLHLFADHSSYIMVLLAPLLWLWEDTRLLVLLPVVAVAVAAVLAYVIGRREGLERWLAFLVAAAVLAHPAATWMPWHSFHPEMLAIPLLPAAYLAASRHRWVLAALCALLILLVKEDAILLVGAFAVYLWWRWPESRRVAYTLAGAALLVAATNLFVALPALSPTGSLIYSHRFTWEVWRLISWSRVEYLFWMLLPLFPALAAPRLLAVALPTLVANLASTHGYTHELRYHYTAYIVATLAVAAPVGAARMVGGYRLGVYAGDHRLSISPYLVLPAALLAFQVMGPSPTPAEDWRYLPMGGRVELARALETIPDDAVVSANTDVAARLSHRSEVYMFPNPIAIDYWGAGESDPPGELEDVDWIVYRLENRREDPVKASIIEEAHAQGWTVEFQANDYVGIRQPG